MQIILTEEEFETLKSAETRLKATIEIECGKRVDKFVMMLVDGLRVQQHPAYFHDQMVTVKHLQERINAAREACTK
jgi:hypothetical protein